jgi:hypothetical protein
MSQQNNGEEIKANLSNSLQSALSGAAAQTGFNPVQQAENNAVQQEVPVTPVREEVVEEPKVQEEAQPAIQAATHPISQPAIEEDPLAALKQRVGEPEVPATNDPQSILSGITVDLSSIEINEGASEMDIMANEQAILGNKKTMQVVAVQSAYSAEISALKNQEIQNISDTNVDFYNYKKRIYKAIWSHIENTSVGKMDFATWMKVTSYFDIDTLLYGAYCQTFPYENKYTLQCPKPDCETPFDTVVNNNTLIETRGREEEIFAKINEVVASIKNPGQLVQSSHVHTTKRISAGESKMVFDIQIPSVFDYLEGILSNVNEQFAEEYSTTLGITLFIKQVLVPDVLNYQRTGRLTFIPVTDKAKMIDLISNLPYYDGLQIADDINEFTDRYRISYSIKGVSCPSCGHELGEIPMDMENVLFTVIRQGRRESSDQNPTTNI